MRPPGPCPWLGPRLGTSPRLASLHSSGVWVGRGMRVCSGFLSSLDHACVLIVRTNPHPYKVLSVLSGQGSVVEANAGRPQLARFLKLQRGMARIGFEQCIVLPRHILYVF